MAVLLSAVSYTCFLSLPFTFFFQCLPHTDILWNNWFASPISWLAVFKVSYSVTLHPSTFPSRVSNGSPETSNGSLDELRFPHSFILHLLMEPEVTFFSQNKSLPQSFFAFLIQPSEGGVNYQLCWIWISVSLYGNDLLIGHLLYFSKSIVSAINLNYR